MDSLTERAVGERANNRCEYRLVPQWAYQTPFQIDHVIARKHGGSSELNNISLACLHCNLHKGPNIAGLDPETGSLSRLFHPREDLWDDISVC